MTAQAKNELWESLRSAKLVEGDLPAAGERPSPWYVRTMLGVAGWIGALFLLGFVGAGLAFILESAAAAIIVGLLCCLGAGFLFRAAGENDFACQFGLALSFAGQMMVGFGIFSAFERDRALIFFLLFIFEAALAALVPNFIHRVLTAWGAVAAFSFGLFAIGFYPLALPLAAAAFALIWLHEMQWAAHATVLRPIGYGLALALLQLGSRLNAYLLQESGWWRSEPNSIFAQVPRAGTVLAAAVFLWVVSRLLQREGIPLASRTGLVLLFAATLLTAASFWAAGLAVALLIIVLGYAGRNLPLVGLGLLALGGFLSHYYYQMQATLLEKSVVLIGTGALLLAARIALQFWWLPTAEKEGRHA